MARKIFTPALTKVNNSNSTNTILKRRAFAPFRDGTLNFYSLGSKGNELTEYKLSSKNNLYYKNSKITEGSDKFKIIAIESSKKYVTVSTRQKNIFVYKAAGLKKAFNLSGHNFPPNCLAISNKEKWLASSDQTGNIFLWNLENGRLTAVLQSKVIKVIDASLGKDQKTLSLLYSSGELKIWNLEDNNIYSEKFDSKKFLKGESENYFPTRIVNETDSTLVFNVF